MKNSKLKWLAMVALIASSVALAAVGTIGNIDQMARWMKGGTYIGSSSSSGNLITRSLGASATIDFVAGTIVCTDSSAITVTGAVVGDACFVGAPAAIADNSTFMCYVSATNSVKVRHCPAGTAVDPDSATYYVRVVSSQ